MSVTPGRKSDNKRYDAAVEIVLDSAVMLPHLGDFWAFVDGDIDEDELRERVR